MSGNCADCCCRLAELHFRSLGACLRGRTATQRSKRGSEKVLGRNLGEGSQKGSEKGGVGMGFTVKKGSQKGT